MEVYTTDLVGRTQLKFTETVNMERIEAEFAQLFTPYVQRANYFYSP